MSHNIDGRWRGHYTYSAHPDMGSGFDAEFASDANGLSGNIMDHEELGAAVLSGAFSYPHVQFTKQYMRSSPQRIEYVGLMSDDGKTIRGKWTIFESHPYIYGSWMAHRTDTTTPKEQEIATGAKLEDIL